MRLFTFTIVFFWAVATSNRSCAQEQPSPSPPAVAGFRVGEIPTTLRDGDIVFHDSGSEQSLAIKKLTHSVYSHVGLYFSDAEGGYVYEAHNGVQKTPIREWSARPNNPGTAHRNETPWKALRLIDHPDGLSPAEADKLKAFFTADTMQIKYDSLFKWSDERMYCSELVWKVYKRGLDVEVGKPRTFGEFDLSSEEAKGLADRYGGIKNLPLNEPIVTPQAIYECEKLQLVSPLTER